MVGVIGREKSRSREREVVEDRVAGIVDLERVDLK